MADILRGISFKPGDGALINLMNLKNDLVQLINMARTEECIFLCVQINIQNQLFKNYRGVWVLNPLPKVLSWRAWQTARVGLVYSTVMIFGLTLSCWGVLGIYHYFLCLFANLRNTSGQIRL